MTRVRRHEFLFSGPGASDPAGAPFAHPDPDPAPVEPGTFRLGRVAGVPVRVHWSVVVVVLLLAWALGTSTFPRADPAASRTTVVVAGVVASVDFLAGLLAHEAAHAAVARRHGLAVDDITLWMFGGVSRLRGHPAGPGVELRVAGAGPLVSLAVGAACGLAATVLAGLGLRGLGVGVLVWLAEVNVVLALFNLVPAAPLDGGRLLHAALWRRTGDTQRAAVTAARAGRVLGVLLVVLGVGQLLLTGAPTALWPALLGWFLERAAAAEEQQARLERSLGALRVRDVMSSSPDTVASGTTVADLVEHHLFATHHSTYPVLRGDRVTGLVTLGLVRRVPVDARAEVRVDEVALPLDRVVVVGPDEQVTTVVEQLAASVEPRALVVDGDRLVGVVTAADVLRASRLADLGAGVGPLGTGRRGRR